ncbi:hypothetical protein [Sphingomonas aquatilis]|uniref:Outer membrane lipoprotein-sorting protein n=1 Tax=Sphingomonas aquatilis TaxID=93063 RepID=A0AAW3TPC6_9SPHN|nr:hypothetical protein [Sphingomonas aquatilis]MBB3873985.1 hypothetical protein [Sphingomonas aquatilis]MCI4655698.1 hypothetical protein [Sphingomonas aquatilis]GEM73086.1 hypothetical protein SAQ01S_28520 [Sphingomonas aquatilis NBRC 16722]
MRHLLIPTAAAAVLFAVPAHADELQSRLLAGMQAARATAFAFQQTIVVETTGQARRTIVERYDPRRPAAERWTLVSVDGKAPTAKDITKAREGKKKPGSYGDLADWFGTPARRVEAPAGYAAYHFDRLPAGELKIGNHDASADTAADVLVNTKSATPFVERVRFTSTKGFRMMLVASVKRIDSNSRYVAAPGIGIVPESFAMAMTGSMMGKSGELKTNVTFSGHQPVK